MLTPEQKEGFYKLRTIAKIISKNIEPTLALKVILLTTYLCILVYFSNTLLFTCIYFNVQKSVDVVFSCRTLIKYNKSNGIVSYLLFKTPSLCPKVKINGKF